MRIKSMVCIASVVVLSSICSLPSFAEENEKTVTVSGTAKIEKGDTASARREAIDDALRNAVEQGLGVFVDSDTQVKNYRLIYDNILLRSSGFVTSYDVLSENPMGDKLRVMIKAAVTLAAIKDKLVALSILREQVYYPRLMILVMSDRGMVGEAEKSGRVHLNRIFAEKHFDLISSDVSEKLHNDTKLLLNVTKDTVVAAKLGLEHHAEVVLTAVMQSRGAGSDGNFETAQSHIRVEAVDPQTAKVFISNEITARGAGLSKDDALRGSGKKGAEQIADYSMEEIIKWWKEFKDRALQYKVILNNVNDYGTAIEFEDAVKAINNVKAFNERHFGGGYLEADVDYKGGKSELQKKIYQGCREKGGLKTLDIETAPGNRIIFKLN